MEHTVFFTKKCFTDISVIKNKIFYVVVHPGSWLSQIMISLETKFDIIFVIILLKMETCLLTCKSASADSQQTCQLLFLYDQSSLGKNSIQFSCKEVDKKLLNQTLQKLFGGGSGWWRQTCTPESITIIGWDVNSQSIQDFEFSKMWVGSVIIWDKRN